MKRLAILYVMLAVLSSGAAYGNNRAFFKSVEGVWKRKHVSQYGSVTFTQRATILRDGTLYSYSTGLWRGEKSIHKAWHRLNGTYRGESYLGGKKIDEGTGKWGIQSNKLITNIRYRAEGDVTSSFRRVNKDKFLETTTWFSVSRGKRVTSEAVITRIRKK